MRSFPLWLWLMEVSAEPIERMFRILQALGMPRTEASLRAENVCGWSDISTCNPSGDLTMLHLRNKKLDGYVPEELTELTTLEIIHLDGNRLTGPLPQSMERLVNLQSFNAHGNQLTGRVPNLGPSIWSLDLSGNRLTGLPELMHLTELRELKLQHNRLSGSIPALGPALNLKRIDLNHNLLSGPIPELPTQLKSLALQNNQLTGPVPKLPPLLVWVDLSHNRLSGQMPADRLRGLWQLHQLQLEDNQLEGSLPDLSDVVNLRLLHLDHNRFSGQVPATLCRQQHLHSLWLSRNRFSGRIPDCLFHHHGLRELLLHKNELSGSIPEVKRRYVGRLTVLALHDNRLTGALPSLSAFPMLAVFTAHANRLTGAVQDLMLAEGCLDNNKYATPSNLLCWELVVHAGMCTYLEEVNMTDVYANCPETCGRCGQYFLAPKTTLHRNRFSCEPSPAIADVRVQATVVMGNMLGIGRDLRTNWIAAEELQDFLYFSKQAKSSNQEVVGAGVGLTLFALFRGRRLWAQMQAADGDLGSEAAARVLRSSQRALRLAALGCGVCLAALVPYALGAKYYTCGQPLVKVTLAYLSDSPAPELAVSLVWMIHSLLFAAEIAAMPTESEGASRWTWSSAPGRAVKWLLWLVLVAILSLPSIIYAVAQALPKEHRLMFLGDLLDTVHQAAPYVIVLVDMALSFHLASCFGNLTGLRPDRLLMSLRLCSAWLLPLLTTVLLHENCIGGWKWFWHVCDESHPDHAKFNWYVYGEQVLSTKEDMCSLHESWWSDGRCSRAVVEGLTPLLLKKLLTRSIVQPLLMTVVWRLSALEAETAPKEKGRHLRLLGFSTTGSLRSMQQHAHLTTLLETAIFWSPLIPLAGPCVVSALSANLLLFQRGLELGVLVPVDPQNTHASVSKSYLRVVLLASCGFQCWHAWSNEMWGWQMLHANLLLVCLTLRKWNLWTAFAASTAPAEELSVELPEIT
ncbi:unnamed protein product [Effrenium voratum]|uniref:ShKT domain-containing protein n=1 Tax=Effrenium voratum TaxID=2562239 RepID=A0AA36HSF3_9DINO|nr:unnamed protein product [Effrenium voratum]CAJ1434721.1 unnamed protein product [Effrenium voratum]